MDDQYKGDIIEASLGAMGLTTLFPKKVIVLQCKYDIFSQGERDIHLQHI